MVAINLTWPLSVLFALSDAYLLVCGLYLNGLALAARRYRPGPADSQASIPVVLLIPAHDEAQGIGITVSRLQTLDYPADLLRRIVIADNCADDTADRARAGGVEVWVRNDPDHPGKGAALRWAIDRIDPTANQAIAILDADSVASPGWLRRGAAYLEAQVEAVQCFYGVENAQASWRGRLLEVSLLLFHHVRSAGRDVLGWSAGLKGNGMMFGRATLDRIPWSAFSVTEDLEYASVLAARGVRVAYDGGSTVLGPAASGRGVRSQRLRWEGGRFSLLRRLGPGLLWLALRKRSGLAFDAAMELLVLPLGLISLLALVVLLSAAVAGAHRAASMAFVGLSLLAAALLGTSVLLGLWAARAPLAQFRTLAFAPVYVAWKLIVYAALLLGVQRGRWVRTGR